MEFGEEVAMLDPASANLASIWEGCPQAGSYAGGT